MNSFEERIKAIQLEWEFLEEWNDRYRLMVEWGYETEPLPEGQRSDVTAVSGCSSPLWLSAQFVNTHLSVAGYSPGVLPMALVALLVRAFDGVLAADVVQSSQRLELQLGLHKHLSPTRLMTLQRMIERIVTTAQSGQNHV